MGGATMKNSRLVCSPLLCFKVQLVALWARKRDVGWVPSVHLSHKGAWEAFADVLFSPLSWWTVTCTRGARTGRWSAGLWTLGSASRPTRLTSTALALWNTTLASVSCLSCVLQLSPVSFSMFVFDWRLLMENNFEYLWSFQVFFNSNMFTFSTKLLQHSMWEAWVFPPFSTSLFSQMKRQLFCFCYQGMWLKSWAVWLFVSLWFNLD